MTSNPQKSVPELTEQFEQLTNANFVPARRGSTADVITANTRTTTPKTYKKHLNDHIQSSAKKGKDDLPDEESSDATSVVIDRENEISLLRLKCDSYRHKLYTANRQLDFIRAQQSLIFEAYNDKVKGGIGLASLYISAKNHFFKAVPQHESNNNNNNNLLSPTISFGGSSNALGALRASPSLVSKTTVIVDELQNQLAKVSAERDALSQENSSLKETMSQEKKQREVEKIKIKFDKKQTQTPEFEESETQKKMQQAIVNLRSQLISLRSSQVDFFSSFREHLLPSNNKRNNNNNNTEQDEDEKKQKQEKNENALHDANVTVGSAFPPLVLAFDAPSTIDSVENEARALENEIVSLKKLQKIQREIEVQRDIEQEDQIKFVYFQLSQQKRDFAQYKREAEGTIAEHEDKISKIQKEKVHLQGRVDEMRNEVAEALNKATVEAARARGAIRNLELEQGAHATTKSNMEVDIKELQRRLESVCKERDQLTGEKAQLKVVADDKDMKNNQLFHELSQMNHAVASARYEREDAFTAMEKHRIDVKYELVAASQKLDYEMVRAKDIEEQLRIAQEMNDALTISLDRNVKELTSHIDLFSTEKDLALMDRTPPKKPHMASHSTVTSPLFSPSNSNNNNNNKKASFIAKIVIQDDEQTQTTAPPSPVFVAAPPSPDRRPQEILLDLRKSCENLRNQLDEAKRRADQEAQKANDASSLLAAALKLQQQAQLQPTTNTVRVVAPIIASVSDPEEVSVLKSRLASAERERKDALQDKERHESTIQSNEKRITALTSELGEVRNQLADTQNLLLKKETEFARETSALKCAATHSENQLEALREEVNVLRTDHKTLAETSAKIKSENDQLHQNFDIVNAKSESQAKRIYELSKELDAAKLLSQDGEMLQNEVNRLKQERQELENRANQDRQRQTEQLETLRAAHDKTLAENMGLKSESTRLSDVTSHLQNTCDEQRKELSELRSGLADASSKADQSGDESARRKREVESQKEELNQLHNTDVDLKRQLRGAEHARDEAVQKCDAAEKSLKEVAAERNQLRETLDKERFNFKQKDQHRVDEINAAIETRAAADASLQSAQKEIERLRQQVKDESESVNSAHSAQQQADKKEREVLKEQQERLQKLCDDLRQQLKTAEEKADLATKQAKIAQEELDKAADRSEWVSKSDIKKLQHQLTKSNADRDDALEEVKIEKQRHETAAKKLKEALEQHETETSQLQKDLAESKKLLAESSAAASTAKEIGAALTERNSKLEQENSRLLSELESSEAKRKQAVASAHQAAEANDAALAQEKHFAKQQQQERLEKQNETFRQENDSLQAKLDIEVKRSKELQEQLEQALSDRATEWVKKSELKEAQQKLSTASTECEDSKEQVKLEKQRNESAAKRFEEINTSHENEIKQLQSEADKIRDQLHTARSQLSELSDVRSQKDLVDKECSSLKHQLESLRQERESLLQKNDESSRKISDLERSMTETKDQLSAAETKKKQLDERIAELEQAAEKSGSEARDRTNALIQQRDELERRAVSAEFSRDSSLKTIEELNKQIEDLQTKIKELAKQLSESNDKRQQELSESRTATSHAKAEADRLKSEIEISNENHKKTIETLQHAKESQETAEKQEREIHQQKNYRLEKLCEELRQQIQQSDEKARSVEQRAKRAEEELDKAADHSEWVSKSDFKKLQHQLTKSNADRDDALEEVKIEKQRHETATKKLKEALEQHETETSQLQKDFSESKRLSSENELKSVTLSKELEQAKSRLAKLQQDYNELKEKFDGFGKEFIQVRAEDVERMQNQLQRSVSTSTSRSPRSTSSSSPARENNEQDQQATTSEKLSSLVESATQQLEAFRRENQELNKDVDALEEEKAQAFSQATKSKKELATSKQEKENLQEELNEAKKSIKSLEVKIEHCEIEKAQQISEVKRNLSKTIIERDELASEIENLKEANKRSHETAKQLRDASESAIAQERLVHQQQVNQLDDSIQKLKRDLSQREQQLGEAIQQNAFTIETTSSLLKENERSVQTSSPKIQEAVIDLEGDVQKLLQELKDVYQLADQAETARLEAESELKILKNQLRQQVDLSSETQDEHRKQNDSLQSELKRLQQEFESTKRSFEDDQLDKSKQRITAIEEQLSKTLKERDELQDKIADLKKQLSDIQNELGGATRELEETKRGRDETPSKTKKQLDVTREALEMTNKKLDELSDDLERAKREKQQQEQLLQNKIEKLTAENNALKKQQDQVIAQLADTSSDETALRIKLAIAENRTTELEKERADRADKERKIVLELEASISNLGSQSEHLRDLLKRNEEISLEKTHVERERDGARTAVERGVAIGLDLCQEAETYSRALLEEQIHMILEDIEQYMLDTLPMFANRAGNNNNNNNNNRDGSHQATDSPSPRNQPQFDLNSPTGLLTQQSSANFLNAGDETGHSRSLSASALLGRSSRARSGKMKPATVLALGKTAMESVPLGDVQRLPTAPSSPIMSFRLPSFQNPTVTNQNNNNDDDESSTLQPSGSSSAVPRKVAGRGGNRAKAVTVFPIGETFSSIPMESTIEYPSDEDENNNGNNNNNQHGSTGDQHQSRAGSLAAAMSRHRVGKAKSGRIDPIGSVVTVESGDTFLHDEYLTAQKQQQQKQNNNNNNNNVEANTTHQDEEEEEDEPDNEIVSLENDNNNQAAIVAYQNKQRRATSAYYDGGEQVEHLKQELRLRSAATREAMKENAMKIAQQLVENLDKQTTSSNEGETAQNKKSFSRDEDGEFDPTTEDVDHDTATVKQLSENIEKTLHKLIRETPRLHCILTDIPGCHETADFLFGDTLPGVFEVTVAFLQDILRASSELLKLCDPKSLHPQDTVLDIEETFFDEYQQQQQQQNNISPTARNRQKMIQRCCASLLLHREVMLSTARQGIASLLKQEKLKQLKAKRLLLLSSQNEGSSEELMTDDNIPLDEMEDTEDLISGEDGSNNNNDQSVVIEFSADVMPYARACATAF